jgi:hypothetical protein
MRAIEAYFGIWAGAGRQRALWLGSGLGAGRKRILGWIAGFGDRLAAVDIDGEPAYVMRDDLDELAGTRPTASVRLLPGFDQWLFGPGTADHHIVRPGKRAVVNRGANVVTIGGVVSGTWAEADDRVRIVWFADERPTAKASPKSRDSQRSSPGLWTRRSKRRAESRSGRVRARPAVYFRDGPVVGPTGSVSKHVLRHRRPVHARPTCAMHVLVARPAMWERRSTFLWPFLGFLFLPWTTLMYVLWPGGINGFDYIWLGFGIAFDVFSWAGGGVGPANRLPTSAA